MESMSEVKLLADEILATGKTINMLINNAGTVHSLPCQGAICSDAWHVIKAYNSAVEFSNCKLAVGPMGVL